MILQALYRYYDILLQDPESDIAPPGYNTVDVSFALDLSPQGKLLNLIPLFDYVERGKKLEEKPKRMVVPEQFKHSNKVAAFFLCDNSTYVLGVTDKGNTEYGIKRFEAFRQFNTELLTKANCEPACAVIAFLRGYDPRTAKEDPEIARYWDQLIKGGRLVFMVNGEYVHQNREISLLWETYQAGNQAPLGQCLVTGEIAPIARLHPPIQGVRNAQTMGASLVSFNERAYESFNRVKGQGLNSPVSERATFGYAKALAYLLSSANPNKKFYLGDTTVVYWAESEKREYANVFSSLFEPEYVEEQIADPQGGRKQAEDRLREAAGKIRRAQALDISHLMDGLDENTRFYILGLAPNAARLSVRFFQNDPFGKIVNRILQHYRDLELVKEFENQPTYITVKHILDETISKNAKDKEASPLMAGALTRAILSGTPYPAALYNAILIRIRADVDDPQKRIYKINYIRAAIIKAYLTRKYRDQIQSRIQEVLCMSLNEKSTNQAYLLGRLFAVLEKAQQDAAAPAKLNATIKDRYFTSACASPATVFPVLLRLSQHHITKAEYGFVSDRRIEAIMGLLEVDEHPIPSHLSLDEQGIFVLGYYHQRTALYISKDATQTEEKTPSSN
jgi:CRISPR-associated protein Csd1